MSAWDGDGINNEDEEDIDYAIDVLGFIPDEILAIEAYCRREAWVHEKTAKYENKEKNLEIARYFWRRAHKFKELAKELNERLG